MHQLIPYNTYRNGLRLNYIYKGEIRVKDSK